MYKFYLISDIDEEVTRAFSQFIDSVPDGGEILIQMVSHGGLVFMGLAITQMIEQAQKRGIKFTVNVYGIAASSAADIILACDVVNVAEGAKIMIHSAWGGTDESITNANDEQLKLIHKRLPNYTNEDLQEDRWFTAEDAVEAGLADSILQPAANSEEESLRVAAKLMEVKMTEKSKENAVKAACGENNEPKSEDVKSEEVKQEEMKQEEAPKSIEEEDLMEALVQRLDVIEHRLAVLEGEGKKEDDESPEARVQKRRAALLQKLNAVCAPVSPCVDKVAHVDTCAEADARNKEIYKNFDELVKSELKRGNRR